MKDKFNHIGYSLIIIALFTSFVLFFFYPGNSELGKGFNIAVIFIFTRYFGLWAGIVVLLLRIIRIIKRSNNLIYIFPGTLNICLGIFGWVLYLNKAMVVTFLHMFIINLFIGVIIFIDVFFLKIIMNNPYQEN